MMMTCRFEETQTMTTKRTRQVTIWDQCKAAKRELDLLEQREARLTKELATVQLQKRTLASDLPDEVLELLKIERPGASDD
jgi:hypothetical protein